MCHLCFTENPKCPTLVLGAKLSPHCSSSDANPAEWPLAPRPPSPRALWFYHQPSLSLSPSLRPELGPFPRNTLLAWPPLCYPDASVMGPHVFPQSSRAPPHPPFHPDAQYLSLHNHPLPRRSHLALESALVRD